MDLNTVKGLLAENFIKLLLNNNKFNVTKPESDYGIDLLVNRVLELKSKLGKTRFIDDDDILKIQVKCTTEKKINKTRTGLGLSYQLEAKTYEDIVSKKVKNHHQKMILIVFILPDDNLEWVKVLDEKIEIAKYAYWYYPSENDGLERLNGLNKKSKVRIELLFENKLKTDFMSIFNIFYADKI